MAKSPAQSEAQTLQTDDSDGQPITRNVGSDPNIRSNTDLKFSNPIQLGRVQFGPKTDPARPMDSPTDEN